MDKIYLLVLSLLLSVSLSGQEKKSSPTDSIAAKKYSEWNFNKFRFGGYGEILYQYMDYGPDRYTDPSGSPSDSRANIALPRVVFATDYKFRDDIILGSEIEFEYGGTGAAMEIEYGPGGEAREYESEIEKGGEVVLEQLHLTKTFLDNKWGIRVGHMIVPIGITNAHHEPIFYFGTTRPEGESTLLPCTWHETGLAALGKIWDFNFNFMLINGLDPLGFSSDGWISTGKQAAFESTVMTSPAFAGRIEYTGIKGLRLGASGYIGNSAKNASKPQRMANVKGTVSIISADAQYSGYNIIARGNFIYGSLSDSKEISKINHTTSNKSPYSRTSVAQNAMTYSAEIGYNILAPFHVDSKLYPFVRYEYYNTMEDVESGVTADPRFKRDIFSFGLNYFILPNLVVKADYSIRRIDSGNLNNENTLGISVGYTAWFIKK